MCYILVQRKASRLLVLSTPPFSSLELCPPSAAQNILIGKILATPSSASTTSTGSRGLARYAAINYRVPANRDRQCKDLGNPLAFLAFCPYSPLERQKLDEQGASAKRTSQPP
ncbi:hypothetical protein BJX61DRAFT_337130 [Aspergillus egyptiacus]|nr:hypothetical protein BJX61DRAFT_337130 [Aspergillus egyptiacus]